MADNASLIDHFLNRGYFVVPGCDACTLIYRALGVMYNMDADDKHEWNDAELEGREAVLKGICRLHGHDFGMDQCGNPDHDFCGRCEVRAPEAGWERVPESNPMTWRKKEEPRV